MSVEYLWYKLALPPAFARISKFAWSNNYNHISDEMGVLKENQFFFSWNALSSFFSSGCRRQHRACCNRAPPDSITKKNSEGKKIVQKRHQKTLRKSNSIACFWPVRQKMCYLHWVHAHKDILVPSFLSGKKQTKLYDQIWFFNQVLGTVPAV